MTTPHRRRMFGDVGPSAPETWLWGGPSTPPPDLLLMLFARDDDDAQPALRDAVGVRTPA